MNIRRRIQALEKRRADRRAGSPAVRALVIECEGEVLEVWRLGPGGGRLEGEAARRWLDENPAAGAAG